MARGKDVARARRVGGVRERRAEGGHQPAGEAGRRRHGDLLAEDGAHGQFEPVPRAGRAQARPGRDETRQTGIFREAHADRRRIGIAVEHRPKAGHDRRHGTGVGMPNPRHQDVALARAEGDVAVPSVQVGGPAISLRRDRLHARDGTGGEVVADRRPVVGRGVGQGDGRHGGADLETWPSKPRRHYPKSPQGAFPPSERRSHKIYYGTMPRRIGGRGPSYPRRPDPIGGLLDP